MTLGTAQKGVARGAVAAAALTIVILPLAALWLGDAAATGGALDARLRLAARLALAPGLVIALQVGRFANHRFLTPEDIDGAGLTVGTAKAKVLDATLRNTLEQSLLAMIAWIGWCVFAPAGWTGAAVAGAALLLLGRALFLRGYERGAASRSFGFGATFYPSVALLFGALLCVFFD